MTTPQTKYVMLKAYSRTELEEAVNDALDHGAQLVGGPLLWSGKGASDMFIQAVLMPRPDPE